MTSRAEAAGNQSSGLQVVITEPWAAWLSQWATETAVGAPSTPRAQGQKQDQEGGWGDPLQLGGEASCGTPQSDGLQG